MGFSPIAFKEKKRRGVHDIEKEKPREWERKIGFV